jgi:hypothetical protein
MQDQEPKGLATNRLKDGFYLYSYVFYVKSPKDIDERLHNKAMIVVNFVVSKEKNRSLFYAFDEFERYLDGCFRNIRKIDELQQIEFRKLIPEFLGLISNLNFNDPKYSSFDDIEEFSFVKEFHKWFKGIETEITAKNGKC